ncbi:hypothetical protein [Acidiphilium acidophilum]|uniref:hypothetical protein n=1 Tax=Acidiphilium acidophilum TaxID=76588 RepID=UPI002E8E6F10|nr:hypothetical protein [Acidiphilium acidophilum]
MPTINLNGAGGGKGGKGGSGGKQSAVARAWQNLIENPSVSSAADFRIAWQNSPVADQIFHMGRASSSPGSKDKFAAAIKALRSVPTSSGPQGIPRLTYQPMTPRLNAMHKVYAGQVGTFGRGTITIDQNGVAYPHKGGLPARIPGTGFTMVGGGRGGGANFYSGAGGTYPERGGVPALYNQSRALVPTKRIETALVKIERATESSARTDKVIAGKLAGGGGYAGNYDKPDYSASYDIPGTLAGQRAAARKAGTRYKGPASGYGRHVNRLSAALAGGAGGQLLSRAAHGGGGWGGMIGGALGAVVGGALGDGVGAIPGAIIGADAGHLAAKALGSVVRGPQDYAAFLASEQQGAAPDIAMKKLAAGLARAGHYSRHALTRDLWRRGNLPHNWQSTLGLSPQSSAALLQQTGVVPSSPYAARRIVEGSRIGALLPDAGALPHGAWQASVASGIHAGYVQPGMKGEMGLATQLAPALGAANRMGASSLQILSSMNRSLADLAAKGGTVNAGGVGSIFARALGTGLPGGRNGSLAGGAISSVTKTLDSVGKDAVSTLILSQWTRKNATSMKSLQAGLHHLSPGLFSGEMKTAAGRKMIKDAVVEDKAGNPLFATAIMMQILRSHPNAAGAIFRHGAIDMAGVANEPGALGRANRLVYGAFATGGALTPGSMSKELAMEGKIPYADGKYSGSVGQMLHNRILLSHPNYKASRDTMYRKRLAAMGYKPGDINRMIAAGKATGRSPLELAVLNKTEGGRYSLSKTSGIGNGGGAFQMEPGTKAQMGGLHGRYGQAVMAGRYLNYLHQQHPNASPAKLMGYYESGPAGNPHDRDWQVAGGALNRILPARTLRNQSATGQAGMAGGSDAFTIWNEKVVHSATLMNTLDTAVNKLTGSFQKMNKTTPASPAPRARPGL